MSPYHQGANKLRSNLVNYFNAVFVTAKLLSKSVGSFSNMYNVGNFVENNTLTTFCESQSDSTVEIMVLL